MDVYGDRHVGSGMTPGAECWEIAGFRGVQPSKAAMLALDETGVIQECSGASAELFGYSAGELVHQHISTLYPQLSGFRLFPYGRFNPMLAFLSHCGHLFQASHAQGGVFSSELSFAAAETDGRRSVMVTVCPLNRAVRTAAQEGG